MDDESEDFQGVTPLMVALEKGHLEVAEAILHRKGGRCMKETDNNRKNVFHYAFASPKSEKATKLLFKQDLSPKDFLRIFTTT